MIYLLQVLSGYILGDNMFNNDASEIEVILFFGVIIMITMLWAILED